MREKAGFPTTCSPHEELLELGNPYPPPLALIENKSAAVALTPHSQPRGKIHFKYLSSNIASWWFINIRFSTATITNYVAYGTQRFNAAFIRVLQ